MLAVRGGALSVSRVVSSCSASDTRGCEQRTRCCPQPSLRTRSGTPCHPGCRWYLTSRSCERAKRRESEALRPQRRARGGTRAGARVTCCAACRRAQCSAREGQTHPVPMLDMLAAQRRVSHTRLPGVSRVLPARGSRPRATRVVRRFVVRRTASFWVKQRSPVARLHAPRVQPARRRRSHAASCTRRNGRRRPQEGCFGAGGSV